MNCCNSDQCRGIEETFDDETAQSDLAEYRRGGPAEETRRLLDALQRLGLAAPSLIDVGGGIGAIQHELAAAGAQRIVNVDASPAYSQAARQEAARRGYDEKVNYHVGNFVEIAPGLEPADIVTMDRVICCYDDMPALVSAAAGHARHALGLVYPVDRLWIRWGIKLANFVQKVLRRPFRIFAHSSEKVDGLVRGAGFEKRFHQKGIFWQVVVYAK